MSTSNNRHSLNFIGWEIVTKIKIATVSPKSIGSFPSNENTLTSESTVEDEDLDRYFTKMFS